MAKIKSIKVSYGRTLTIDYQSHRIDYEEVIELEEGDNIETIKKERFKECYKQVESRIQKIKEKK